jgi:hypothetical protein
LLCYFFSWCGVQSTISLTFVILPFESRVGSFEGLQRNERANEIKSIEHRKRQTNECEPLGAPFAIVYDYCNGVVRVVVQKSLTHMVYALAPSFVCLYEVVVLLIVGTRVDEEKGRGLTPCPEAWVGQGRPGQGKLGKVWPRMRPFL